jgi:hypothetical protein
MIPKRTTFRSFVAWAGFAWRGRTFAMHELLQRKRSGSIPPPWLGIIPMLCMTASIAYVVLSVLMSWPMQPFILMGLLGVGFGILLLSWFL